MARPPIKFFVELGSANIKLVAVTGGTFSRATLQSWSSPSQGIRKGAVSDLNKAITSLESVILNAERFVGRGAIKSARLLLPGYLLQSRSLETRCQLSDGIVSSHVEQNLLDSLAHSTMDDGIEVVDTTIQAWNLDGVVTPKFPLEKRGRLLSLVAFCSTCESSVLSPLIQVCNAVGIEITSLGSSMASASKLIASLSADSSNRTFLDIGHTHSQVLLQVGSRLNSTYAVAVGSQHMTRDIAAALGSELEIAEQLKRKLGLSISPESQIALPPAHQNLSANSQKPSIAPATLYPWLAPRVAELLRLAHRHFALYSKALDGGVIVFGGGSLLSGLTSFAANRWEGVNVTRFKPSAVLLSVALDVEVLCENDDLLLGSEGLLGAAAEYLQELRSEARTGPEFASRGPQFLRPLLTWFSELAR